MSKNEKVQSVLIRKLSSEEIKSIERIKEHSSNVKTNSGAVSWALQYVWTFKEAKEELGNIVRELQQNEDELISKYNALKKASSDLLFAQQYLNELVLKDEK